MLYLLCKRENVAWEPGRFGDELRVEVVEGQEDVIEEKSQGEEYSVRDLVEGKNAQCRARLEI